MANYVINYSCGHGSVTKQLYGKTSERERRIEWMEGSMVCPDCYKKQIREEDDRAEPLAEIHVRCNGAAVSVETAVVGQTYKNKEALEELGIHRRRKDGSGFLSFLGGGDEWYCGKTIQVATREDCVLEIKKTKKELAEMGYAVKNVADPSSVDLALAVEFFRKQEKKAASRAERDASDPKPTPSPLRQRIAKIEEETGARWNGKIYGRKGSWNFYVNNENYDATDEEVSERETICTQFDEWKKRNADLLD